MPSQRSKKTSGKGRAASPEAESFDLPPSLQPKMPEAQPVNREEILALGQQAAELLSAPIFNEAYRMTVDQIVEQWLTTDDPQLREQLWLQAQNLAAVTQNLLGHVNAAQSVNLTEAEMADQDLSRFESEQGFL